MPRGEIQAVEVSCFVQATEDEGRLRDAIASSLAIGVGPEEERLEGHFGNRILALSWHLTGEQASTSFRALFSLLGQGGRREVLRELEGYLDDHGALYVRLNKQTLVKGVATTSQSDPVRIRIKPRTFLMKGQPRQFYERLMEAREGEGEGRVVTTEEEGGSAT
ncbi:MAG: RNA-binding domain-containing protein [Nitrososphaerales archaeon]